MTIFGLSQEQIDLLRACHKRFGEGNLPIDEIEEARSLRKWAIKEGLINSSKAKIVQELWDGLKKDASHLATQELKDTLESLI